jgi:hypothetical protein
LLERGKQPGLVQRIYHKLPNILAKTGDSIADGGPASVFSRSMKLHRQPCRRWATLRTSGTRSAISTRYETWQRTLQQLLILATAAKSDRSLSIFGPCRKRQLSGRVTGRLMQTRSASLFMGSATRLQARAAAILGQNQIQWAGEIG